MAPKPLSDGNAIPWTATAFGATDGAALISQVLEELNSGSPPAVFIDDAVDLLETEVGPAVQKYIEALRLHDGSIVVAAGSWLAGSSFHKGLKEIRAAGWGYSYSLIRPATERSSMFGCPPTRRVRRSPDAASLLRKGALTRMQVATIEERWK